MKKVFKFGTGKEIPEGAIYLSTVVQEMPTTIDNIKTVTSRFVWHYFLIEVK